MVNADLRLKDLREKKRVRPKGLEPLTARSGVERATNCAIAPRYDNNPFIAPFKTILLWTSSTAAKFHTPVHCPLLS